MSETPIISVIVPTFQRRKSVVKLLAALARQKHHKPFETLVIVDGSTDGTVEAVKAQRLSFPCRVIEQENRGQAAARNRGAAHAAADVLVFFDDDVIPRPNFLDRVTARLESGVDVVLARIQVGDWVSDSLIARDARCWDADRHQALLSGQTSYEHIVFAATAVRRSCFEQLGGFEESFTFRDSYGNEDVEFGYRLLKAGAKVAYEPLAIACCQILSEPTQILQREYQTGRNDVRLVQMHPELARPRFAPLFAESRIHRVIGPVILALPALRGLFVPLHRPLRRALGKGLSGPLIFRAWLLIRAVEYWRGVADAEGRAIVRNLQGINLRSELHAKPLRDE